jgi:hypothetical protein
MQTDSLTHSLKLQKAAKDIVFNVQGTPIENVKSFKYLGRTLDENDDDWPALKQNLNKAHAKWTRIRRVLSREKANPKAMASFYKAIIQAVLLYGSESWVVTKRMMQTLRGFHNRCARYLTGQNIRYDTVADEWIYPNTDAVLKQAGLWPIEEYIKRRCETVMDYVKERAIYQQCLKSTPTALSSQKAVWWKQ